MEEKKENTDVQPLEARPLKTESQGSAVPELDEQFGQLLERNLPRYMEQFRAEYSQSISVYQGPFPPASDLEKLKEVDPTFPEKLIMMAQAEQEHTHAMERLAIETTTQTIRENQRLFARGQMFGFAIGTISVLAGAGTAIYGEPLAGSFIGTGGVAALVAAFIYGSRKGVAAGEVNERIATKEQVPAPK